MKSGISKFFAARKARDIQMEVVCEDEKRNATNAADYRDAFAQELSELRPLIFRRKPAN